ncbi:hypothetical protein [Streptomyces sp. NPDC001492]
MPEPELHVRDLTPPMPVVVCESGRHINHPGETCEEFDELQAAFRAYLERGLAAAYASAMAETDAMVDRFLISGDGSGEMRGFLPATRISIPYPLSEAEIADHGVTVLPPEPTPAERAFAILEPHLHNVPLYRPRGRLLP